MQVARATRSTLPQRQSPRTNKFAPCKRSSSSARTTPFLANAEASLTAKPIVRAFAGLNYDSRVPGISPTRFTGPPGSPTSTTPAGINFSGLTSYDAGGGVIVKF